MCEYGTYGPVALRMCTCVARCKSVNTVHMGWVVLPVGEMVRPGGDRNSGLGVTCGGLLDGSHLLWGAAAGCMVH